MANIEYSLYTGDLPEDIEPPVIRVDNGDYAGTVFTFRDVALNEETEMLDFGITFITAKYRGGEINNITEEPYTDFGESTAGKILLQIIVSSVEEEDASSE